MKFNETQRIPNESGNLSLAGSRSPEIMLRHHFMPLMDSSLPSDHRIDY